MKKEFEIAIKDYQCLGCILGPYPDCFEPNDSGVGCGKHHAGTMAMPHIGRLFLGLPKGFCRLGPQRDMRIYIFGSLEQQQEQWKYDCFNVPVWKHKNKKGHILIRGFMPRVNSGFLHIIINGDMDEINCLKITKKDMAEMD